jgi:hypothetical protein
MLVNLSGLVGYTGGHVLGNFSVTKQKGEVGTGVSAKIKDLVAGMELYRVVLESGGKVIPGGYSPYAMAAKQLMDNEVAPGREWAVNGMGANVRTMETPSAGGGRGKPMKMYLTPIISFGYGLMRGYSPMNHQPYSSNGGWINLLDPVVLAARCCRVCDLLPRSHGEMCSTDAQGAGWRRLHGVRGDRCGLGWSLRSSVEWLKVLKGKSFLLPGWKLLPWVQEI